MKRKNIIKIFYIGTWLSLCLMGYFGILAKIGILYRFRCGSQLKKALKLFNSQPLYSNRLPVSRQNNNFSNYLKTEPTPVHIQTHIGFLKVHKAGSSTMQNMYFRFGLKYNLSIFVPKTGNFIFPGEEEKMPPKTSDHYDIFAIHTIYRNDWFKNLLPSNSVIIGIVREPVERMISAAFFYRDMSKFPYLESIPRTNFINNLVNFPEKYDPKSFSFTKNAMARDFGFQFVKPLDKFTVRAHLNKLNSQFLLVLVLERFNESLVLMRRSLNWTLSDIVYLSSNIHSHQGVYLNETEIAKFKRTSYLDFEVYEYFSKVLAKKIELAGDDFQDEHMFYKTVLERVSEFCLVRSSAYILIEASKWCSEFTVSKADCILMKTSERSFLALLRKKQGMVD